MNKIQAINIVNNCFAFKARYGILPDRNWRGITNEHRFEAFRIVNGICKRAKATQGPTQMCRVDPCMSRVKMSHTTTRKVPFPIDI